MYKCQQTICDSKKYMMKPNYPKDVIASAAAKIDYIENIGDWESSFKVPLKVAW